MVRALLCWSLLLGVLAVPSTARADRPLARCYPSGLKVAVVPREGAPVVGVATVIDGGSSAELPGEEGAAHVLEHLWFRSPRMKTRSFEDLVYTLGGEANAFTAHDHTIYLTVAPRTAIRSLVAVEGERMADPVGAIDAAILQSELRIVGNEIAERYDGRDPAMRAILEQMLPEDHPYARRISGTAEQLASLDLDAVKAYAARQYVPARTTFYVTGDVPAAGVLRMFEEALPPAMRASPDAPEDVEAVGCTALPDEPRNPEGTVASGSWTRVEAGVDEPLAVVAWPVPVGAKARRDALHAADLLNFQFRDSRIDAGCSTTFLQSLGALVCSISVPEGGTAEDGWKSMSRAMDTLRRQAEYAHPKGGYWRAVSRSLLMMEERRRTRRAELLTPGGYLEDRALFFHRTRGEPNDEGSSVGTVRKLLNSWLVSDRALTLTLVPADDREVLATSFHRTRGELAPAATDEGVGTVDLQRLQRVVVDPGLDQIEIRTSSGRPIWVLPRAGVSTVRVGAVYPGDAFDDVILRDRTWDLLGGPWDQMHEDDANRAWREEVSLQLHDGESWWGYSARGTQLQETVRALTRAMEPPIQFVGRKDRKEEAERVEAFWAESVEDPYWRAARVRWNALADGLPHPAYDRQAQRQKADIKTSEARRFAEHALDPRRARVVAVARPSDVAAVHEALAHHLGAAIETEDAAVEDPEMRAAADRSLTLIERGQDGLQATVQLACHVEDGDSVALWVVEKALRASLNQALRNDLGVTYGVHPDFYYTGHGTTLYVSTQVPHGATGTAIHALLDTLGQAADGSWEDTRIDRLKLDIARGTALRWQDPEALFSMLQEAAARGWSPSDLDLAARLDAVNSRAIAERLAPCVGKEVLTVIGSEQATGPALEASGIAWKPEER